MDEAVAVVGAAAAEVDCEFVLDVWVDPDVCDWFVDCCCCCCDGGGVDDNLGLFVKILLLIEFIYFNSWNLKLEYLDRFWFFRIKNY